MTGSGIETEAAGVRASIAAHPATGATDLIHFANEFALSSELRHNALILKLSYLRADEPEQRSGVASEMSELVDRIVADNRARAGNEEIARFREAYRRVRQHYREVDLDKEVVFRCENLGKTYRKGGFTLSGVGLELRRGEITGVVGQNAYGKTTLFKIIAGELRHDTGHFTYPMVASDDGRVRWASVREQMAYVPQELPKWHGALLQKLQYEAALHGIRGRENREEVDFIIERLGLQSHLAKSWGELSGGFKLRFSLARALVWKPKLLLLDEPLANLDFQAQLVVLKDLRDLASSLRYPMAVLISSQHLHEIEAVADNLVFLREGAVVYNGPVADLGATRRYNTFELGADRSEKELSEALEGVGYRQLYHTGLSFVLTTPLELGGNELLQLLTARGITVEYFRDISKSIKQLFN